LIDSGLNALREERFHYRFGSNVMILFKDRINGIGDGQGFAWRIEEEEGRGETGEIF
jgi:hypothetical protein